MEEGTADEGAQFTFYWERSCPGITEGGDAAVPEAGAGLVRNHGGGHRRVRVGLLLRKVYSLLQLALLFLPVWVSQPESPSGKKQQVAG